MNNFAILALVALTQAATTVAGAKEVSADYVGPTALDLTLSVM